MRTNDESKLFVLDTNVALHDAGCLKAFEENDVALPITVLEELDKFKKGHSDINFQAREFLRSLDSLTGDLISEQGASLGTGLGTVRVTLSRKAPPEIRDVFLHDDPDNRIVNAALILSRENPGRRVILVSKDTNIRLKAKALGLVAQDYIRGSLESVEKLYKGIRKIEGVSSECIDLFYREDSGRLPAELPMVSAPLQNENFIIKNGSKSVLATFRESKFNKLKKQNATALCREMPSNPSPSRH